MAGKTDMPIAVVGMSCRFPGDAIDVESFWDFLAEGRAAVSDIPKDRFNVDAYYHPSSKRQGSMNVRRGHFLKQDVSTFDAPFFSMTKSEADATDPQQRLLLEVAYEAFENAGMSMEALAGSKTSVYAANFMTDYKQVSAFDSEDQPEYGSTGHSTALIANRVSWFFDLRGPSLTLDTGCSGSAVAFHLACESIRTGDADCALACGVNLILAPEPYMSMTAFNFLSPDGICYTFDHRANGYTRGEGFAAIALKPLDKAIHDNDTIRAVIRSTAVAQDGKTPGITLPSREAQASLIKATYSRCGLDMAQTGFFEAHGTGTVAGDAAELGAIGDAFAVSRSDKLIAGSVKTNVGHLEGCSSLAGIIKGILCVEKGQIPANLNFERPHPDNDLEKYKVTVPTTLTKWQSVGVRRASVSCFGFGGTIAHIILDDVASFISERAISARHITLETSRRQSEDTDSGVELDSPQSESSVQATNGSMHKLLVWSAPEKEAVARNITSINEYMSHKVVGKGLNSHRLSLSDLAYTLSERRSQFQWRSFAIASDTQSLAAQLGKDVPATVKATEDCRLCLVFTGQGAQWPRMGEELYVYPSFRQSVQAADEYLKSIGAPSSVVEELQKPPAESMIDRADLSQAVCTVVQCALVDLLHDWSIEPYSVVGHSSGEIAAAYCAGAISREAAWTLAYYRGNVCAKAPPGSMLAVGLSATETQAYTSAIRGEGILDIACLNSARNTTVSGDENLIAKLHKQLSADGVFSRRLKVNVAYHSRHMHPLAEQYFETVKNIELGAECSLRCRMFSSVTGKEVKITELNAEYFANNLRSPVHFTEALLAASVRDFGCILEIGPHSALQSAISQTLAPTPYASALVREKHATSTALAAVGKYWTHGGRVDLTKVNDPCQTGDYACLSGLPPYSWNHRRSYWWEAHQSKAQRFRQYPRLDLLGAPDPVSNNLEMRWRNFLRPKAMPWLVDHQVQNTILYPAAGMLVMVVEAVRQFTKGRDDIGGFELCNVFISKAMVVPNNSHGLETILSVKADAPASNTYQFAITSRLSEDKWQENCTGSLVLCSNSDESRHKLGFLCKATHAELLPESAREMSPRNLYEQFEKLGMKWGPSFRNVVQLTTAVDRRSRSIVRIPDTQSLMPLKYEQPHLIHPATLDAMVQSIVLSLPASKCQRIPQAIDYVFIASELPNAPGTDFVGSASTQDLGLRSTQGSVVMRLDTDPVVVIEGLRCTDIADTADNQPEPQILCSINEWQEDSRFQQARTTVGQSASLGCGVVLVDVGQSNLAKALYTALGNGLSESVQLCSLSDAAAHTARDKLVAVVVDDAYNGVASWSATDFKAVKKVFSGNRKMLCVTTGAQIVCTSPGSASLNGMLRSLRYEDARLKLHTLDLEATSDCDISLPVNNIINVMHAIMTNDAYSQEYEFAARGGKILIPRVAPNDSMNQALSPEQTRATRLQDFYQDEQQLQLVLGSSGQLNTLHYQRCGVLTPLGPDEIEIRTEANEVRAIDAATMLGQTTATQFGSGIAGTVARVGSQVTSITAGDRVVTFQPGSVRNTVRCASRALATIPNNISFAQAAAISSQYTAAYYALFKVAHVKSGERCLVTSPCSATGQASLHLAAHIGVEVYAVVSNTAEIDYLQTHLALPNERILSAQQLGSRPHCDNDWWDVIILADPQGGVQTYWQAIAEFGRLVQILPGELLDKPKVSLVPHRNATFTTVDLEAVRQRKPAVCTDALRSVLRLLEDGFIRPPVSLKEMPYSRVSEAYAQSLQPDNVDSIVLTAHKDNLVPVAAEDVHLLSGHLRADASYVIVGGLGGLGRSIATYLVKHGAKHLVFLSRSGGQSAEVQAFLRSLQQNGAIAAIAMVCDVANRSQLQRVLTKNLSTLPPVKGVIQAAMVLRDQLFENMSYEEWTAALRPKIHGSWNLHELLPQSMDFFVLLSSIAGVGGMKGQANYAAGNSYQDALAHYRRNLGLPAVCIDLTVVLGVGFVAENTDLIDGLKAAGVFSLDEEQLHRLIKCAITGYTIGDERTPAQIITGVATGAYLERNNIQDPMWLNDNRFEHMCKIGLDPASSAEDDTVKLDVALPVAKSIKDATRAVIEALTARLAKALAMPVEDIQENKTVSDYGVDSLVAVELRNWIQRQARATVSIFDLMSPMPIKELATKIANESSLLKESLRLKTETVDS